MIKVSDAAAKQIEKSYQLVIENPHNSSTVSGTNSKIYQINSCLKQAGALGEGFILPIVMNTDARTEAYIESLKVGSGKIRSTLSMKECGE